MKKKNENNFLTDNTDQGTTESVTHRNNSVSETFKNDYDPETVRKKNWIAFLILIAGLVLTTVAVFYIQRDVAENARQDFASICDEINLKISARIHAHALLLRNGAAFFKASNNVSREEWKVYNEATKIDYNLPGIQGMGFSLIIPKNKLAEHIKNIRKQGFPNYTVYPAGDRDIYTSIIYLEPFEGRNLRAFGYDMFSEPVRRKAMELSRDNDLAELSGKVLLVQETKEDIQPGTLMYVPVYRNGMPVNTVKQRRAAILGWVYSPYRMTDLMKGILDRWGLIEKEEINLKVYDDSISANSLLYDSQKKDSLKNNNPHYLSLTMPLEFHGKKWVLFFTQPEDTLSFFQSKVIVVLISGILLSLLLFLLSISLINTRRRALQIANHLTLELKENAEKYKDLSNLLESIIDHIPGLLFYKDKKNNYIRINKYIATQHGKQKSEIEGKNLSELYSKEDAEKYYQDDLEVINSGVSKLNIEEEWKTEEGIKWINTNKIPFVNNAGEIIGIIGISLDITERKNADLQLRESEERFSAAFHGSPNLISITRLKDGMIIEVNEGYTQLLGYSRAESIGNNTKDLSIWLDPVDRATFIANLEKYGFINNFETKLRCKDGSVVTVLDSARTIKLKGEECILSIIYDITDRKRAEDIIRNSNLYNRSLIEASIDPLVTIGPDGKITDVNKATEDVTGLHREQLIGSDFSDYFTEPLQADSGYKQVLEKGFVKDYPLTIRHADGKTTDVLYNATVYKNQDGNVVGVFAAARDITESKKAEEIIRNANLYNRSLIEASIDPLVTIGPDGKITDVNKATEDVTGIRRDQLIGSDFSNYFTEPLQADNGYKQVLEKGFVKDYPLTIRHSTKKTTDVLYNATVYKNADGKVVGVFAAARDITETKKNEEALIKSESNLRAIFENTAKGFLLMDDTFTVIEFNSLMEKYITISDNIILRKNENIFINIPQERQEFLRAQFNSALDGEKVHYEISYLFSGNTTIYFEVKMYPVLDPDERVAGICISYEDITTRKLAEEQIIELNKDLDKKVQERTMQYELVNQELESFTFSVSHDLRAPLRAVNSYAQILEEDYSEKLDEDGRKMLKHIENNGKKMGRLIDDLLAFSRLGRKELKRVDVNMNDLTKAVIEELNQTFPNQAKIEISDLPVVQGDYSLLYQAMLNLVSNAIKYSSKKDKPVIKIFTEQKDGKTIFTIKDNGAGFDMRFAEKLFGVFQRLHSEEEFEGSGIGLAIVHRIIAKHGGEVWGEGKVNEGATFHFKLN
ncbi:phytochrome-like protein cph1 [mine drainage metagenome]|uniref:histidine kinase n=1 Tax=mine drainage metagenome TaxID=410659 RepID=A0A1J5S9F9_9ZZZZ